jgi:hypothetical protein
VTQTADIPTKAAKGSDRTLTYEVLRGRGVRDAESLINRFVSELRRMTPQERIEASRYSMNRWERWIYAARYPDEVPLVNGELEWIAMNLE